MTGKDAIRTALQGTQHILTTYLADLSDADLLVRPAPGANHVAWQVGHLIDSEKGLLGSHTGAAYPELPAGFAERHSRENTADGSGFRTKAEYVELFQKTRAATLAALEKLSDGDLDKPASSPVAQFAPTLGALLLLVSNHTLMHGGQVAVLRRKLGKPIVI